MILIVEHPNKCYISIVESSTQFLKVNNIIILILDMYINIDYFIAFVYKSLWPPRGLGAGGILSVQHIN